MGKKSAFPTIAGQHRLTHQPGGGDVVVGVAPGAHAVTHAQAGVDPIIVALDARAIALTAQGEIAYRAAAANTLAVLAVGVAGQSLLSGGPAANISWGAPAPAAHESTHVQGGADDIDSALDARAIALALQGQIVFHAAAANTLSALATGVAGHALLTGGVGADPYWGFPEPAAHESSHVAGGADDIDSALDARALAFANQGEIVFRAAAANTLAVLATGVAGQALLTGGAGADPSWGAPAPAAHESTHVDGGADEIDSALDGRAIGFSEQGDIVYASAATTLAALAHGAAGEALLSGGHGANPSWGAPAPAAHESTHVAGGADDIDSALDARALGFANQGEIVFRAAAANTLGVLATGVAGQALLTGGAGADPSWGAPTPAAHVLDTTGPHTGTLLLTDLEVGVQGEVIIRGAADWEALGVGAALQALLSGGAGADPYWGAPTPAAHVLATTGPHTGELPLTDLAAGVRGNVIIRGAADWEALAVGTIGHALLTAGAGADPYWGVPAPAAHESTHILGGSDDIDSGLDARALNLANQGEIVFRAAAANTLAALATGAAGQALLTGGAGADPSWGAPTPAAHVLATTGPHTGELPLTDLIAGARGEIITRTVADWAALGVGAAGQALLSGGAGADVSWGAPAPAAHESTHVKGGSDDIDSALDARAIALTTRGDIVYHAAAANTLARLAAGTAGYLLKTGGPAGDPSWELNPHIVGEVLAIITCPLSGPFTTTAGAAAVVNFTDMLVNISDFPADAKGILRITWKNSGNNTNNMDLYDQFGAAPVANSSESEAMATDVWEISETDAPFTLPAGLKSFLLRLWTSGGTLTVAAAHLQIERAV